MPLRIPTMSTISPFTRTVVEAMRTLFVSREDRFVQLRAKLTSPAIQRNTPIKALIIPAVRCLCLPSEYAYLAMAYHDQKLIKKKSSWHPPSTHRSPANATRPF